MRSSKAKKNRDFFGFSCWFLASLLFAFTADASWAQSQLAFNAGHGSTIAGAVLFDGETQPAARVRVDVRDIGGSDLVTTFTDSSGRFQAPATRGTVIVRVQEQGYEPVEQRVSTDAGSSGLVITLHKLRVTPVSHSGYTVSVRDFKVPAKAKRAFDKGVSLLQKKDLEGSLDRFKEATDAFPDYYEAYYQIGLANLELRRGNDAEQALQRAIDLSGGGYVDPQLALGALLCDRQDYVEAERVLRRAIDLDASSWKGYLFLGQALFGQNRLPEAEKSAREALLRKSDTPSAYLLLANVHIRRHEYILGVKDLDAFLSLRPTGPTADQARSVRAAAERIMERLEATVRPPLFVY